MRGRRRRSRGWRCRKRRRQRRQPRVKSRSRAARCPATTKWRGWRGQRATWKHPLLLLPRPGGRRRKAHIALAAPSSCAAGRRRRLGATQPSEYVVGLADALAAALAAALVAASPCAAAPCGVGAHAGRRSGRRGGRHGDGGAAALAVGWQLYVHGGELLPLALHFAHNRAASVESARQAHIARGEGQEARLRGQMQQPAPLLGVPFLDVGAQQRHARVLDARLLLLCGQGRTFSAL